MGSARRKGLLEIYGVPNHLSAFQFTAFTKMPKLMSEQQTDLGTMRISTLASVGLRH